MSELQTARHRISGSSNQMANNFIPALIDPCALMEKMPFSLLVMPQVGMGKIEDQRAFGQEVLAERCQHGALVVAGDEVGKRVERHKSQAKTLAEPERATIPFNQFYLVEQHCCFQVLSCACEHCRG